MKDLNETKTDIATLSTRVAEIDARISVLGQAIATAHQEMATLSEERTVLADSLSKTKQGLFDDFIETIATNPGASTYAAVGALMDAEAAE